MRRTIHGVPVIGLKVGAKTECAHYRTTLDIVAIKFPCCGSFYPCYQCHEAVADHPAATWPAASFSEPAILCGACGRILTIAEYLDSGSACPACKAAFNPGCRDHWSLYFET